MPAHDPLRELVVGGHAGAEIGHVRPKQIERRDVRTGAPGEDLDQAEVIHVLVGDHDQPQLLDRPAEARHRLLELIERLPGVRAGVDERQRLVLDQVTVDPPDRKRSRQLEPVDPLFLCVREAQERITASTSSRRRSMSSRERRDSRQSRSNGSVFDGRTLKCHSSYSTERPSRRYWCASE